ncbi:MAG: NAD(P)H-dependent glycerol-3-phosphate dehydrogenase [Spirochaetia bacterium]|nr:NAD(P)H-dependent glycerol-3-phosphate dehydrogenase [Spirochaetia bacterium]
MNVVILGAGSFGTALALVLADNGHRVKIWSHLEEIAKEINEKRENAIFLPEVPLSNTITATHQFEEAFENAELVLSVVPTQVTREVWEKAKNHLPPEVLIISASKGIEQGTLKLVNEIIIDEIGVENKDRLLFLSGPSFAKEVARKIPTLVTIAGNNKENIMKAQHIFKNAYFRTYGTTDVIGVELGGALKNIIALACGISDGLGMGHNSRAAIMTRGLAEIARLGIAMGAKPVTFMGLAGVGDLILTCTGDLSRNRSVGLQIGFGKKVDEILKDMRMVAEGVTTTESAYQLSKKKNVEMPITEYAYEILYKGRSPADTLKDMMSRKLRFEEDNVEDNEEALL